MSNHTIIDIPLTKACFPVSYCSRVECIRTL